MTKYKTILVVDDNPAILTAVKICLEGVFERVLTLTDPNRMLSTLQQEAVEVILLDMNFGPGVNSGQEGLLWLRTLQKFHPNIPVVLVTAYAGMQRGQESTHRLRLVTPIVFHGQPLLCHLVVVLHGVAHTLLHRPGGLSPSRISHREHDHKTDCLSHLHLHLLLNCAAKVNPHVHIAKVQHPSKGGLSNY